MLTHDRLVSIFHHEREREVARFMLGRQADSRLANALRGADDARLDALRLHLRGHSVIGIARRTHQHFTRVAEHLKVFDAVLVLHLHRIPPDLAASILGYGRDLIDGCHELIRSYLEDPETSRRYLARRGIHVATTLPGTRPGRHTRGDVASLVDGRRPDGETLHESWC